MKKIFYAISFLMLPILANAQKTNPVPYCASEYNNNYNMMKEVSIGAYTHSFGAMGSTASPNTYLYVDTANFPKISKDYNVSMFLDLYSVPDAQPTYFGVWIDYNHNDLFDTYEMVAGNHNSGKALLPTGAASDASIPVILRAPASAFIGKTRMRITRTSGPSPYDSTFRADPCAAMVTGGSTWGNTYDFDVSVIGDPSGIAENPLKKSLTLSPNPAASFIVINNNSTEKIKAIILMDMTGKVISTQAATTQQIDISNLANGMYWANILLENGANEMRNFIKN